MTFPITPDEITAGMEDCTFCYRPGFCKNGECGACALEARQRREVQNHIPEFKEWNPLKRRQDELLVHPYQEESHSYSRHAN